jgi:transketolase
MTVTNAQLSEWENLAKKVREHCIRMATDGGCFLGASLSCTDILAYLYSEFLNINQNNIDDPNRDYLFLSKGHDVPALYGVLAEKGFFKSERLANHLKSQDYFYWHPNRNIPGIEFYSGSLGHLLSVAIGVSLDCRMRKQQNKIIVIVGDGEMNEGSVWEALMLASAYKLENLILIIDRNGFQANLPTEELIPLEPLENKLEAFRWTTHRIDGHNFSEMHELFTNLSSNNCWPTAIIADTIRGKGLPSIENRADRWFCNFSHNDVDQLLNELNGQKINELSSQTLIVR